MLVEGRSAGALHAGRDSRQKRCAQLGLLEAGRSAGGSVARLLGGRLPLVRVLHAAPVGWLVGVVVWDVAPLHGVGDGDPEDSRTFP